MSAGSSNGKGKAREEEDEEEDLMQWEAPYYKDSCLWLIDNSESMHQHIDPKTSKSYVQRSIEVACKMMEHKLVKSPNDKVGIMLFNTKETKVPVEGKKVSYQGCYVIRPIEQVGVPGVMELRDEMAAAERSGNPVEYWREKYPPDSGQIRIHYALGNAEAVLASAGKTGSRRIFFVTNKDDPYEGRSAKMKLQKNALDKIKEMRRKGIEFEAFFINSEERPFDVDAFYADLFQAYDEVTENMRGDQNMTGGNDPSTVGKSSWSAFERFEDLENDAGARETPKRVIFRLAMELGPDFKIGVAGYNLTARATKANPVKVYREGEDDAYQEIMTQSHMQCRDTGKLLDPQSDIYHAFALGFDVTQRSTVRFTPEEINTLKTSGMQPVLKVLGFKEADTLRFWENVKHSIFIFPSEAEYLGSQRAFAALLKVMLAKNRIGYGIFMSRPASIPEFVAILPQAEERNESGAQTEPPGMHLIPLPFADDIRDMPTQFASTLEATDEQVAAAGKVVKTFSKKSVFNPDYFPNPALNHHYEVLKAVAFGVDIAEPTDRTLPNYEEIETRAGKFIAQWQDLVQADERATRKEHIVHASDKKRPIIFDRRDEEELLALHAKDSIDKKTAEYLRAALDFYRISKIGKKAEIVERLQKHLDKVLALRQGKGK